MLGCFNPELGQIWVKMSLKIWILFFLTQIWVKITQHFLECVLTISVQFCSAD